MAIVICPKCGQRTSSASPDCRACGAVLAGSDPEADARLAARARRARARSLTMQAALATLVGLGGGFWLMFGEGPRQGGVTRIVAAALFVGGLGWYLYVRIAQWTNKRR